MLAPHFELSGWAAFSPSGHVAVLVFFLLSGYVIGISTKPLISGADVRTYLRKRAIRLYPMYILALVFTFLVAIKPYPWTTILAHATFTQNVLTQVVQENNPLWSLQYEVLFFIAFVPLSYLRINSLLASIGLFLVGIGNLLIGSPVPILISYIFGFVFWLLGLFLAQYLSGSKSSPTTYTQMLSALLLLVAIQRFNVFMTVATKLESLVPKLHYPEAPSWYQIAIDLKDFAYLPYCLFILLTFIGKEYPFRRITGTFIMLLPLVAFRYIAGIRTEQIFNLAIPIGCYLASLLLYFVPHLLEYVAVYFIKRLIQAGSISYGIYIIHLPLLYAFTRVELFSDTPLAWLVRAFCYIAACVGAAYLLEKIFHKRIRTLLEVV